MVGQPLVNMNNYE